MDNKKRSTLSWSVSLAVHATGAIMILVAGFHIATPSGTVTDKTEFTAVDVQGAPSVPAPVPVEVPPAAEEVAKPAEAVPEQEVKNDSPTDSEAEEEPKPFTPTESDDSAPAPDTAAADPAQEPENSPAPADSPAQAIAAAESPAQVPNVTPDASPNTSAGNEIQGTPGEGVQGPLIDETKLMEAFGNHKPDYPWMARLRRQQGTVVLRAFVDKDGSVSQVTIEKSSGSQLIDDEAQRTYGRWRYQPGLSGQVLKPFKFSLN